MIALFMAVILAAMVAGYGRSSWYKDAQFIIGMMLCFIPTYDADSKLMKTPS